MFFGYHQDVMDSPLWIDRYSPSVGDFPQEELRYILSKSQDMPINFLLYGPEGSGKTSAARIIARGEEIGGDLIEFNISDLVNSSKKEIIENPLFSGFISSKKVPKGSKISLIIHLIKESASYPPVSGGRKVMILDNFESSQRNFQQALRRIIEQYHHNTQFILTTRQLWKVIPAIRSRCYSVSVGGAQDADMNRILRNILTLEGIEFTEDGIEFIVDRSGGDIRSAIMYTQAVAERGDEVTLDGAIEIVRDVGIEEPIVELVECSLSGRFSDARSILEGLMITSGYSGGELLEIISKVVKGRSDVDPIAFALILAEIDFNLSKESNSIIHLTHFLTKLGSL